MHTSYKELLINDIDLSIFIYHIVYVCAEFVDLVFQVNSKTRQG